MSEIIYPSHYRILECKLGRWFIREPKLFHGNESTIHQNIQTVYGLSERQVVINLFRLNGGKSGFYLANLRDRKFYYCGEAWEDIKTQLLNLGIGRADP